MFATAEFKVGLFVLLCIAVIAAMSLQVNNDPTVGGKGKHYQALLGNANGIVKNSNIKMAGIPVGIIKDIELEDGMAKVDLVIRGKLRVATDASIEIKPNGILGDKYIELKPGSPDAPELPENGMITHIVDQGSFDVLLSQLGKIAGDIGVVAENLKKATSGDGDDTTPVGRILQNVEDLTADIRDLTSENKEKINETLTHIHSIAKTIDGFVNDESDDGFKTNWKKMAKSLGRVDSILKNVDEITGKINSGKGTIGKLVNDEQTVEELNHAIAGVNNLLDTSNKFQINVDAHSELDGGGAFIKSYVGINIQPGPDRYYLLEVVSDPKGSYDSTSTQLTGSGGPATSQTANVYHNRLTINAEFAKSFYDFTLRVGIFQNTGGVAGDYYLFGRKLRLSVEAFNFSRPEGVDVRAYVRYKFYSVFYAMAGGDDIMNSGNNTFTGTSASGFFGLGVDFSNDDLKLLLSKAPL